MSAADGIAELEVDVEIPAGHEPIDELFRQARAELFK
jgi:hypothetical protein